MKISVITISFNQAIYLRQTIESVVSQRDVDIEYIVVDPGSSDGSREIIQTYKDKLEHIIFEKDSGPGDGLNKGFEKATGDIFCYLNSDDFFEPDVLAWVNNVFAQDPSLGVLYGACNIVDENSSYIRKCFSDRFGLQAAAYGTSIVIQPSTFF